jgi:hypothetical protein
VSANSSHPAGGSNVALIPAKIIARLGATCTSDVAELSWEWAMRADGEVVRRMTAVNGHRERNSWQLTIFNGWGYQSG